MRCGLTARARPVFWCTVRARLAVLVVATLLPAGCFLTSRSSAVEPSVTFAAHPGYRGLVVDRMAGGQTAILVGDSSAPAAVEPNWVLRADGKVIAGLWSSDHDSITVRRAPDAAAPLVGQTAASWENGALRLTVQSADGAVFHTTRFKRVGSQNVPTVLDNEMLAVSQDLPGDYRAEIRDRQHVPVGWLQVRILPYQGLPREYQGDIPEALNGSLATAAVVLVDSAIDAIVARNSFPEDRIPEGLVP